MNKKKGRRIICVHCRASAWRPGGAFFCAPCLKVNTERQSKAHAAVAKAVKAGQLSPVHERLCVDCGAQAHCYDHRDYAHPLDVHPVCRTCNLWRGPSAPPAYLFRYLDSAS